MYILSRSLSLALSLSQRGWSEIPFDCPFPSYMLTREHAMDPFGDAMPTHADMLLDICYLLLLLLLFRWRPLITMTSQYSRSSTEGLAPSNQRNSSQTSARAWKNWYVIVGCRCGLVVDGGAMWWCDIYGVPELLYWACTRTAFLLCYDTNEAQIKPWRSLGPIAEEPGAPHSRRIWAFR